VLILSFLLSDIMVPSWDQILPYALLFGLVAFLLKVLSSLKAKNRQGVPPPSLPWLPVVGSLPFLPKLDNFGLQFMLQSKKRGKVFAFYAGHRFVEL
jgi:hypothetical protein